MRLPGFQLAPPAVRADFVRALAALLAWTVLLGAVWVPAADAAIRDYYFNRIGSERGLAQNTVTALAQDPQGFVWVGTQGGLHRYDGQHYAAFLHDPRDPTSLPDSYVTALALEADHTLWVGSYSQFVARLDLRTGHIQRFGAGAATRGGDQPRRHVLALLPQDGRLWVGTAAGLERFDPVTGLRQRVLDLPSGGLSGGALRQQLLADRAGNVWYANAFGLFRIDRHGKARRIGPAAVTRSLRFDHRGQLWIGRQDGLYRLQADEALVRVWPLVSEPGSSRVDVLAVAESPDRQLWFSVYGEGLRRLDPASGAIEEVREHVVIEGSLPEASINALLFDRGGMLWVGGQFRGVAVADPRGTRFRYIVDLDADHDRTAASDNSVRAIHQGADQSLWIATDSARLLHYDFAGDRFDDRSTDLPTRPGEPPRQTAAFADAGNGRLWLATSRGLLRFTPGTADTAGRAETIALGRHTDARLRSLLVDRHGDLWLGTSDRGALHYQRDAGRVIHYGHRGDGASHLAHPMVHALLEDRRGRIWFGTGDGLDMLDPASGLLRHFRHDPNGSDSLPNNLVRALHESRDGTVWVGTHAGLSRVVEQPGGGMTFTHPLAEALGDGPAPVVFSIAQARGRGQRDRRLWLGTNAGIVRFDPDRAQAHLYGLADGLQDLEFNGGALAHLDDGRIALGGVRGVNLFQPAAMASATYVPPLRLLAARVGADAPADAGPLWQTQRLAVPDGAQLLRLRIGALDFAPAANTQYRYQMDGFDEGWISNGPRADITYTRLPPGNYTFRAQASNRDGGWSAQELRVPVRVAPPLWRHPLAIGAEILAALLLLATLGWRWRQRWRREQGYFRQIREREERLKLALWGSGELFWDYDLLQRTLHRMRFDEEGDGSLPEVGTLTQTDTALEIHPDDLPRVEGAMRQHLRGDTAVFESEHRTRNGAGWSWLRARGRVVERDASGRPMRVSGTARDVTAYRSAERERRISSEVLRSMAEAVAVFDRDFVFASVNPAFTRMTGYDSEEVIGRSTSLLDSLQHDPAFYSQMRDEMQRHGRWSGEVWQQRRDESEFLCWLQASAVSDSNGQRGHYVAVLSDITDQKRAEQELRYLANYDTLTSLPNRTLLSERLSRAIVRARRNNQRIAVLFLDLDRFKDINDSLGHAAGDRILRAAADRLQETLGAQHTVARLGGDEFTVILEDVGNDFAAEAVARELIAAFERPLNFDDRHEVTISPSIGISLYPDDAQVPTDLLKHADTAMYQAKAIGRRTFMRYTDTMDIEIRRRATISAALRKVLDRDELRLVYQPRLSLPEGRITGVEALLRWQSADYGNIMPEQFIPLAEENGLILEIGEWALREACAALQRWRQQGVDSLSMAVNVSSLQLLRGDLPQLVARVLAETGVPAQCLELELTESVIMSNAATTSITLQEFRALGISLAIDDFGTGYSSLAYLKRLPITTLKIDKTFVDDLPHDTDDAAITSTIISMAHSLGLNVVAEGVETEAQLQFLRKHGCDEIQGYWLARPLEAQQCLNFIQTWASSHASAALPESTA